MYVYLSMISIRRVVEKRKEEKNIRWKVGKIWKNTRKIYEETEKSSLPGSIMKLQETKKLGDIASYSRNILS